MKVNQLVIVFITMSTFLFNCRLNQTVHTIVPTMYQMDRLSRDVNFAQKIAYIKKTACLMVMLSLVPYHFNFIVELSKNHPVLFVLCSILAINYTLDSLAKYRHINESIKFVLLAHKFSYYVLALQAIRNSLKEKNMLEEKSFENAVLMYSGHSLSALQKLAISLLSQATHELLFLKMDKGVEGFQKFGAMLQSDDILIDYMLTILNCDRLLREHLLRFYNSVDRNYDEIIKFIGKTLHDQCCISHGFA